MNTMRNGDPYSEIALLSWGKNATGFPIEALRGPYGHG